MIMPNKMKRWIEMKMAKDPKNLFNERQTHTHSLHTKIMQCIPIVWSVADCVEHGRKAVWYVAYNQPPNFQWHAVYVALLKLLLLFSIFFFFILSFHFKRCISHRSTSMHVDFKRMHTPPTHNHISNREGM